jgi:hypothetical protein
LRDDGAVLFFNLESAILSQPLAAIRLYRKGTKDTKNQSGFVSFVPLRFKNICVMNFMSRIVFLAWLMLWSTLAWPQESPDKSKKPRPTSQAPT